MSRIRHNPAYDDEEEIQSVRHVLGFYIEIVYGYGETDIDGNFIFVTPQQYKTVTLNELYYTAVMSPNPSWAPTKPAGEFRNDDLWAAIDAKNNGTPLAIGT